MTQSNLYSPIEGTLDISPRFISKLKKLGIRTVKDVLYHFPFRYEDYSRTYKISELEPGLDVTISGLIEKIESRRAWTRRKLSVVEAVISDNSGKIKAVWFNQSYLKNTLKPGTKANFAGKVVVKKGGLQLSHPSFELIGKISETRHTARIVPIYPETKGLTSKGIRYILKPVLERMELEEFLPKNILEKNKLPEISSAIRNIHFPDNIEEAKTAKRRFTFEELFLFQLHNVLEKEELAERSAPSIKISVEEIKRTLSDLPFELTRSQKKSLWEIMLDLEKPRAMNRLLQGDVGSGKTIIAAIVALKSAEAGWQSAFMAPTEILARQHYMTFTRFFPGFDKGIALLTSSESRIYYGQGLEAQTKKNLLIREISEGKINIVIGTHALIQKEIGFKKPGLVVIDEQHRFGVRQRKTLLSGNAEGKNQSIPHFLSMSATPIPRTLMLALFNNLELSVISELPKNRKRIITKVVSPQNRQKAYNFIKDQINEGRQAFVICPRIKPSEENEVLTNAELKKIEIRNVTEEYEKLSKRIFPELRIAMLHGKIKPKEKEKIMKSFSEGQIDILISTSVVEVGVDIPNATVMMIEGSERFGLAQLYQFRGRVGRGEHQSFCFLFTDSDSIQTRKRLESIVEAKNGMELAEKDLNLRGPGEFLGFAQTGMPDLAMKVLKNPKTTKRARAEAELIIKGQNLKKYPALKDELERFREKIHEE